MSTELQNDLLLRALLREPVERTPVWMMRQAGRYLVIQIALQTIDNFLGGRQVAGTHKHKYTARIAAEDMHLADGADVVHARIGTRIRGHHQALIRTDAHAISHRFVILKASRDSREWLDKIQGLSGVGINI